MSILTEFCEGWDLYGAFNIGSASNNGLPWAGNNNAQKAITTDNPRTGRASFRGNNGTSALVTRAITDPITDFYFGFGCYINNYTNVSVASAVSNSSGIGIGQSTGIVKQTSYIQLCLSGSNGEWTFSRNGVAIFTTGPTTINAYHYHIFYYNKLTGDWSWWIDRALVGSGTTTAGLTANQFQIGRMVGNGNAWIDDIFYLGDPSGAEATAIEAALEYEVRYAMPSADGATQQWTRSAGVDSYALIDEQPQDLTDYLEALAVSDVFEVDNTNISAGVFSVLFVQSIFYGRKETAGAGSIQKSLVVNGTAGAGANHPQATTEAWYEDTFKTSPDTGVSFIPAELALLGESYERTA